MKVTTEGCLFGAWLAAQSREPVRILDIGAGTGLLMLMTAQAFKCPVEGIELDPEAASQAGQNIEASPWAERLKVHTGDVKTYLPDVEYDLVVSNPPFHSRSLKSEDGKVNMARHDDTLPLQELLQAADRLMSADGSFAVWLPVPRAEEMAALAGNEGWRIRHRLRVARKKGEEPFRNLMVLKRASCEMSEDSVHIRETDGVYGERFAAWLKPYYLNL